MLLTITVMSDLIIIDHFQISRSAKSILLYDNLAFPPLLQLIPADRWSVSSFGKLATSVTMSKQVRPTQRIRLSAIFLLVAFEEEINLPGRFYLRHKDLSCGSHSSLRASSSF